MTNPSGHTDAVETWTCSRCGSGRWVGWRGGPGPGFPRRAQCIPCGHVQELPDCGPEGAATGDGAEGHECDAPRCPKCSYTQVDADQHMDHHLCDGEIPARMGTPEHVLTELCPYCPDDIKARVS